MYSKRFESSQQAADVLLSSSRFSQRYGAITSSNNSVRSSVSRENINDLRRTLGLLVTFDLILTFILWVLAVKMKDGDFEINIKIEFVNYSIKRSYLDFVICSIFRFILLIFFYILIKILNPSVVAITTFLTCIFIVVKTFISEASISAKSAIFFVIMIESFLVAWIETWFIDFRLLPQEKLFNYDSSTNILIAATEPEDEFGTPSEGSDDESRMKINTQDLEYWRKSRNIWNAAVQILMTNDGWCEESTYSSITVRSRNFPNFGRIFRLETTLDYAMSIAFEETNVKIRDSPLWNKTIIESEIIKVIDPSTDIVYHVTASAGNGVVKSRDFVSVRHWRPIESSAILSVSTAIECPYMPVHKYYIRGETHLGAWMYEKIEENNCRIKILVATDIKGWIPKIVADQAISSVMIDSVNYLKTRLMNLYPKNC